LFFHANVLTEPRRSFKFQESSRLVDPLLNPIELDAIYNHIPDHVLPMKIPQEAWKGAQDHSHAFMQVLLETCSPHGILILDITIGTCLFLNFL
jgi:hypothetical protein